MDDDLLNYLDTLSRGDCFRVDAVLKESDRETTERVFLIAADGSERGPYIRKRIALDSGLGTAYERLWQAQQRGKRFIHLPRVIECTDEAEYRSILLEFVEGETLDDHVLAFDFSSRDAAAVAKLLCDAVLELHESFDPPLIHRDLKPSNVVISPSNLTLIDLGIARTFDEKADTDTRSFGTRGYAPPEQFGYGQTDERSDVYALGMLIAFCFLREEPSRELVNLGFDDPRIPQALRPVLAKATAFDPADRYASARELQDDLSQAQLAFEEHLTLDDEAVLTASTQLEVDYAPPVAPPEPPMTIEGVSMSAASVPHPMATSAASQGYRRVKLLSSAPRWLGIIWNVLVIGAWLLFAAVAVSMIFTPGSLLTDGRDVAAPAKAVFLIGAFVIAPAFFAYPFLDKRGIRERLRLLPRKPWLRELGICLLIAFALVIVSTTIGIVIDGALN